MSLFKFKKGSKITPKVGMYFFYGSDRKIIFKIIEVLDDTCLYAWSNENSDKVHITGEGIGISIRVFIQAVIDKNYTIISEKDYYAIPERLRNFKS